MTFEDNDVDVIEETARINYAQGVEDTKHNILKAVDFIFSNNSLVKSGTNIDDIKVTMSRKRLLKELGLKVKE